MNPIEVTQKKPLEIFQFKKLLQLSTAKQELLQKSAVESAWLLTPFSQLLKYFC